MKKYVSLIVCAILSLTALFIPIGSDARSDGKGPGKNATVNNLSELQQALNGKSGTYTFEFDEGISLERFSLLIPTYYTVVKSDGTVDDSIKDYVPVYKTDLTSRVTDLHSSNTGSKGYGRFADDYDFIHFKDFDMKTGLVKVEYQNDSYGKTQDTSKWTSVGLSSATELGLNTYEAKQAIKVYKNSALTQEDMTMDTKDVFIHKGSENGAIKILYSKGEGFETGYINSSADCAYVRIMVYEMEGADHLKAYDNKIVGNYSQDDKTLQGANNAVTLVNVANANKEKYQLPTYSVFRYHGSQREIYKYTSATTNKLTQKPVESATISFIDTKTNQWTTAYISNSNAYIVNAKVFNEKWVMSSQKGSIKLFVESADCYYAQIDLDITINNGTVETYRTAYNAELYVKGDVELVKFNYFFHLDGRDNKNKEVIANKEFIRTIKTNEWMTTEQAKIYLDSLEAENAEYVSPLNEFADRYLFSGKLGWSALLSSILDAKFFNADGDCYALKDELEADFCNIFYSNAQGHDYDVYFPDDSIVPANRSSFLKIDLSDSTRPVIKANYIYSLAEGDVFKHNTAAFESGSDRTLVIENIGNTIIPKVVVKEIQKAMA